MCESLFHDRSSLLSTPSHHTTAHSATCSSASLLNQKYLSQDSRYPTDVQIATRKEEWREGDRSLAHYPPPKKKKNISCWTWLPLLHTSPVAMESKLNVGLKLDFQGSNLFSSWHWEPGIF